MRVAIVHYHLDPGGVTTAIHGATRALDAAGVSHVVLTGTQVPGLGYRGEASGITAGSLAENLHAAATAALGAAPDCWHFHNHSLGKNALMAEVVARFAASGARIVLQIHDLAEQGRPANYALIAGCAKLYPFAPRIRYAFLNSRDLAVFLAAGLPPENAVLLPNPILLPDLPSASPPCASSPPLLFAPIRGIRRKNLGELVLLAALAPAGARVAISRAPRNPEALPIHENWRKFAAERDLPIGFDVVDRFTPAAGAASDFDTWVGHATHFVTTSVCEGFGLPFLESIAHGKPLLGRELPHLAADHGIRFPHLYQRILIPVDWVDLVILESHLATTLERNFRFHHRPVPIHMTREILDSLVRDELLDFGNLPEPLQQGIIEKLAETAYRHVPQVEFSDHTRPLENWLAETLAVRSPASTPQELAPWSLASHQAALTGLYQDLANQPAAPVGFLPPEVILNAYLTPASFHFLLSALAPKPGAAAIRAVIFDIYGTLLIAPAGGVKPDPLADPVIRDVIRGFGHEPPASPSSDLHAAVLRHHAAAGVEFPEIDLRVLWREVLGLAPGSDTAPMVEAIEAAWHPARPMPGAEKLIYRIAATGLSLGLLSNAQSNTLTQLGPISDLFAPELTLLSYQHGIAKPSPELFRILTDRLAGRGISPAETLFVGNDPAHDILPAEAAGFRTVLFTGPADWRTCSDLLQ